MTITWQSDTTTRKWIFTQVVIASTMNHPGLQWEKPTKTPLVMRKKVSLTAMSAEDTAYTTNMGLAIAGNVTDMH